MDPQCECSTKCCHDEILYYVQGYYNEIAAAKLANTIATRYDLEKLNKSYGRLREDCKNNRIMSLMEMMDDDRSPETVVAEKIVSLRIQMDKLKLPTRIYFSLDPKSQPMMVREIYGNGSRADELQKRLEEVEAKLESLFANGVNVTGKTVAVPTVLQPVLDILTTPVSPGDHVLTQEAEPVPLRRGRSSKRGGKAPSRPVTRQRAKKAVVSHPPPPQKRKAAPSGSTTTTMPGAVSYQILNESRAATREDPRNVLHMSESPEFLPKPSSISTGEAPSSPPRKRQNAKEVETPDPSRVCDICNKVFTTSIYARKHRVTHSSKRPFSCRPCNKDYWRKDQLQAHVKRCHGTNQGPPAAKQTGRKRCVTSHGIRQPGPGRRTKRAISLSPPPYNYKNARAQQTKDNASRASSLQSVFGSSEACLVPGTSSLELLKMRESTTSASEDEGSSRPSLDRSLTSGHDDRMRTLSPGM